MRRSTPAVLLAGLLTQPAWAEDIPTLETIVVTASRIPTPDVLAPYASEIHTRRDLEASGATTLFDYLAQHSSLTVMPSFGGRAAPMLDARGYGLEGGFENLVVTLDGVRLNNIDLAPTLLGHIPLNDIESIEIDKGTGSVLFGDNAGAGVVQIRTRGHQGVDVAGQIGSFGAQGANVGAGFVGEGVSLSVDADALRADGDADPDVTGHRNDSASRALRGHLGLNPGNGLSLGLDLATARVDERYVEPLTLAQFQANPYQAGGVYALVVQETDSWRLSGNWRIAPEWTLAAWHHREDKAVDNRKWSWKTDYAVDADDVSLAYKTSGMEMVLGWQRQAGERGSILDRTSKTNTGWYASGQWRRDGLTLAAGARGERVDYEYAPAGGGGNLRSGDNLQAWDLGVNQRIDGRLSLFANLNRAFQAPDIDRFFTSFDPLGNYTGPQFNGFIQPQTSHTLSLGLNHITAANRLKLSLYRSNLENEIYFFSTGAFTGVNTNLDRTHKYGLELQDAWRLLPTVTANLNYTFTRALIDREDSGGGAFNGKSLPGVPRHGVVLGVTWIPAPGHSLGLTHTWRQQTWAIGDFDNNNVQRQAAYLSTDLAYRRDGKGWSGFVAVRNVFAHKNAVWTQDDVIYPVNLSRVFTVGLKAGF